jgi:hypothetical protein
MELRGQQVLYGIVEVIATHNLVKYVKGNGPNERVRMAAGATMAGLGFVFGPELEERFRHLPQTAAAHGIRREVAFAAGGAALGAVTAYLMRDGTRTLTRPTPPVSPIITPTSGPIAGAVHPSGAGPVTYSHPPPQAGPVTYTGPLPGSLGDRLRRALGEADPASVLFDPAKPGGLVTIASAGWLGYSLFFDGKTKEEQHRHLWGLGAGALGYLYGPESIRWIKDLTIPKLDGQRAINLFNDGSVLFGAAVGGIVGYGIAQHTTGEPRA